MTTAPPWFGVTLCNFVTVTTVQLCNLLNLLSFLVQLLVQLLVEFGTITTCTAYHLVLFTHYSFVAVITLPSVGFVLRLCYIVTMNTIPLHCYLRRCSFATLTIYYLLLMTTAALLVSFLYWAVSY